MNRKQFQELAAMLREHRRVVNTEFNLIPDSTEKAVKEIRRTERDSKLMELNRLEISIAAICSRNNDNFNEDLFREAANYAFDPD